MAEKGILFFAINNKSVNYLKMAYTNATLCKKNLGDIPVSVITSSKSIQENEMYSDSMLAIFDKVIIDDNTDGLKNMRRYSDTQYHGVQDQFINGNRNSAYESSPYEQTLLLDVDFLMLDSSMNSVWDSIEDFMINDTAIGLDHEELRGEEGRLNPAGIKMVWATAIYFRKTERAKLVFDMVAFIKENWDYYKLLYGFGGALYRNDFSFSIALHMLNGYQENNEVKRLPIPYILTSTDRDQIYEVGENSFTMFYNDQSMKHHNHNHEFYITKIKNHNIHIMNKISMMKFMDEIIMVNKYV